MLEVGVGLMGAGLVLLVTTMRPARSEDDVRESLQQDEHLQRELGPLSGRQRNFGWAYRTTYRHPVLMRAPGVILVLTGTALVLASGR